jgi:hypothetical protein
VLQPFSTPQFRNVTFALLSVSFVFLVGAVAFGIDNGPPGLLFAFLAPLTFSLAFVHPWRTARQFRKLFYIAGLSLPVFVILHNLADVYASRVANGPVLHAALAALDVASFLLAVVACPALMAVGIVGAIIMFIHERHAHASLPAA